MNFSYVYERFTLLIVILFVSLGQSYAAEVPSKTINKKALKVPAQSSQPYKRVAPQIKINPQVLKNANIDKAEPEIRAGFRRVNLQYTVQGGSTYLLSELSDSFLNSVGGQVGKLHSALLIFGTLHMNNINYINAVPVWQVTQEIIDNAPQGCDVEVLGVNGFSRSQAVEVRPWFLSKVIFHRTSSMPECWAYFKGLNSFDASVDNVRVSKNVGGQNRMEILPVVDGSNRTAVVGPVVPW